MQQGFGGFSPMAARLQLVFAHSPYSPLPSHKVGPVLGLSQGNAILLRRSRTKHNMKTRLVRDSPVNIDDVVGHFRVHAAVGTACFSCSLSFNGPWPDFMDKVGEEARTAGGCSLAGGRPASVSNPAVSHACSTTTA
jgi:hypothetical protein